MITCKDCNSNSVHYVEFRTDYAEPRLCYPVNEGVEAIDVYRMSGYYCGECQEFVSVNHPPKQTYKKEENVNMGFKKDSKKASNFDTIQPGEYEVFIEKAMGDRSKQKGTPNVSMRLKIRDDIDQEHSKQIIFHNVYLTPNTEGMVHGFLDAVQIDDSYEFDNDFVPEQFFALAEEIAKLVKGKSVRVKTKIEGEYARVTSFKVSEVGGELEITDEGNGDNRMPDISDDDLPF